MKILAIDTSLSRNLSLGILDGSKIISQDNISIEEDLSKEIVSLIERLLKKVRLSLNSIDCFAVSLGPGSFTGLRIGLSAVKALSFALSKPLIGISSLDILAESITSEDKQICSIIDAKRNNVYACLYHKKNGLLKKNTPYLLMNIDCFTKKVNKKTIFVGDGLYLYKHKLSKLKNNLCIFTPEKFWQPKAANLIKLSLERFKKGISDNPDSISAIYLYPKECQIRKG